MHRCCSDIFFVIEVWFSTQATESSDWLFLMFILGCLFVLLPLIFNLFQLNKSIREWIIDYNTRNILQPWILQYSKTLYLLSVLTGSAFSAIELCDSHLFELSIFSLNIPKREKQMFKNKRIFSIVLCENIPQFCLQLIYLLFVNNNNNSITIVAMSFSILSIIITLFEYSTNKFVFESECLTIIKFNIESRKIQKMKPKQFNKQIANKRNDINHELAKILSVNYFHVEQLKPTVCSQGAAITCYIRSELQASVAMNEIHNAIQSHRLQRVCVRLHISWFGDFLFLF